MSDVSTRPSPLCPARRGRCELWTIRRPRRGRHALIRRRVPSRIVFPCDAPPPMRNARGSDRRRLHTVEDEIPPGDQMAKPSSSGRSRYSRRASRIASLVEA